MQPPAGRVWRWPILTSRPFAPHWRTSGCSSTSSSPSWSAASFDENFADSGQVAAEQGETHALASSLKDQLDDVEQALVKLDEGTYGLCERCEQPIPAARLEAMPASRFCIEHA